MAQAQGESEVAEDDCAFKNKENKYFESYENLEVSFKNEMRSAYAN